MVGRLMRGRFPSLIIQHDRGLDVDMSEINLDSCEKLLRSFTEERAFAISHALS